jgi:putative oxidoreductase
MSHPNPASRVRITLGTLRGLLAFVFIAAGIAKLVGLPFMVEVFNHAGLGQWFRYLTGAIEVGSAILLLTRPFVGVGALVLSCTMAGAIIAHLTRVPGSPVPAIVLLVLSAVVAFAYRQRTLGLVSTLPAAQVA